MAAATSSILTCPLGGPNKSITTNHAPSNFFITRALGPRCSPSSYWSTVACPSAIGRHWPLYAAGRRAVSPSWWSSTWGAGGRASLLAGGSPTLGGDPDNDGAGRVRSDLIDWEDDDPLPRVRGPHGPASHALHWPPPPPCPRDTRASAQVHQVNIHLSDSCTSCQTQGQTLLFSTQQLLFCANNFSGAKLISFPFFFFSPPPASHFISRG